MQSLNLIPERNALPEKGARFWREGEDVMFRFVIDAGNIVGPRLANRTDSENHPHAWTEFASGEETATAVEVVPGAREAAPAAPPESAVEEKDMDGYAERLEPEPPRQKRAYTKRRAA